MGPPLQTAMTLALYNFAVIDGLSIYCVNTSYIAADVSMVCVVICFNIHVMSSAVSRLDTPQHMCSELHIILDEKKIKLFLR